SADEAGLGGYVQGGIGSQAVGAGGGSDSSCQEIAEKMKCMAACSMGSRTIDGCRAARKRQVRVKIVAVNEKKPCRFIDKLQQFSDAFDQPARVPNAQLRK